jgi:4-amino-4-deoxy-L-arabinose transferase-like glycosyltransferase
MAITYPAASDRAPMLRVSLIVEALRARPALMVWAAALAQGALWTLVPALFYAAPPGDVPLVLAVGREWLTVSPYGPPLSYWLAECAFRAAGNHVTGVYLLAQVCVIVTYLAVFWLGRRIVGAAHAAIAVLLMVGISAFTVPSVDFGPAVLAMPLTALSLLFLHRAVVDNHLPDWLALGLTLGLLLFTTQAGLILVALIVLVIFASGRGRARLGSVGPWTAAAIAALVNVPQLLLIERAGFDAAQTLATLRAGIVPPRPAAYVGLALGILLTHAALVILLFVAGRLFAARRAGAPVFERQPVDRFGRCFVYVFWLVPLLIASGLAAAFGASAPFGGTAPLVILSGLAVVMAAGDTIRLYRERTAALVWLGLLIAPPAFVLATMLTAPVTAIELEVSKPAAEMAQFFTETFRRRTGKPLAIVAGDARSAGLVAITSSDRPRLYVDGSPARAPWITDAALREKGAIVMWTATDAAGTPPAHLKARFPDMVAEVPRSFERTVQGRLPLLRIGWAVIRPQ